VSRTSMIIPLKGLWIAAALFAVAPTALAQDDGASGQLEQGSSTSDREKLEFAESSVSEMNDAVKSVSKKLETAERESDDLKIQCLSKKLSGIRALSEVSADAKSSMEKALSSGDTSLAEHEFRKIAVALSKVRQFQAEAEACVGDSDTTPGVTDVNVSIDGLTEGTETDLMDPGDIDIGSEPPDQSPFQ